MESVRIWLERLGLGRYGDAFESNDVDLEVLPALREADLERLGVSLGHRKRILRAILDLPPMAVGASHQRGEPAIETVTAAGERRQVTVLFCDLVGSVALSSRTDPEDFRATMTRYHASVVQAVQRYEGYVAQIQGDGVIAYFGHPIAHEGEAERAIRAALAIVDAVATLSSPDGKPLQVRLGIASGLVVVSHILASDKSAVGDTPNLAHRLQGCAAPGEIIVAESTRALAGGGIDFEDRGRHKLKGLIEPARLWRVLGVGAAASRFEAATRGGVSPLVGREQEIGLLLDRWQLARCGTGQVVAGGEPGIGKSRIMRALRERLGGEVQVALQYQCSSYYTNSALYPVIDHLERALKFEPNERAGGRFDKLERWMQDEMRGGRHECGLIARLLNLPADERYGTLAMTPQRQKEETLRALTNLVAGVASARRAIVLFEDAHWADPTTIECLEQIVAEAKSWPLLVLITFRPEFQPGWADCEHVTTLTLNRLSPSQSANLIARVAGGKPLPPMLVSQIADKTDGVPLFLEELTKAVLESGMVVDAGDRYEYASTVDRMTVPATLRDSLMARLDRLIPVKEIAQIGAVIGREFGYDLVAAISPMRRPQLLHALDRLTSSGLVFRRGTPPNAVYTFKHALVQDAAYDSLLKVKRQELHAQIAEAILKQTPGKRDTEPELLAHHYTAAGQLSVAVPLWHKAGQLALHRMALAESIAHLERGLGLVPQLSREDERDEAELSLRSSLGTTWMALRGWPAQEVADHLEPAIRLARKSHRSESMISISFGLWANVLVRGRIADSLQLAKETLDEADAAGKEDLLIVGHVEAMISEFWLGNLVSADEHGQRILALYEFAKHKHIVSLTNFDPKTAYGLYASHWVWMLGYPDEAVRICIEKDEHARRIGHIFDTGFALTTGCQVFEYRCEPERALERVEEAERLGRENSVPFVSEVLAAMMRGMAYARAGRAAEAVSQLEIGIGRWHGSGANIWNPYARAIHAEAMVMAGKPDDGLRVIDECIEQTRRTRWEERAHLAEILRLKAWMHQRRGMVDAAEALLRESVAVARKQQAKSWELRTTTQLAEILVNTGEMSAARDLLEPLYGWFTEGFGTRDLKSARALLERLD